ncbi:MAG: TRAP-type mannitol/chloroaromatic compound transport system permease small subunit [Cellvibrionaceae bacterium]|jgi:TRAP-type mannitol/chloroaromatic compound transport system permease small subunit
MWFFYPLEVKIMNPFLYFVDSLSAWMGKMFAWCIVLLTFATVFEVFVRYVLNAPTSWAFDMAVQMYGALFMMAGAYTLSRDGHVRGDVIHRLLPIKYRASLDLTLYILFLMPGCVALVYYGYEFASDSWRYKEVSWSSPARTQIYFFKTIIPLAGFLVLLQGIAEAYRCVICIRTGAWPARLADVEETEDMALNTNEETGELAK